MGAPTRHRFAALHGLAAATIPFLGVAVKFCESQFQSCRFQAVSSPAGTKKVVRSMAPSILEQPFKLRERASACCSLNKTTDSLFTAKMHQPEHKR